MAEERREHEARRAVEEERRHGEGEEEMLDHVRAEEEVVRQIAEGTGERAQEHGEAREEAEDIGGLDGVALRASAAKGGEGDPPEGSDAHYCGRIGVSGRPHTTGG